MPTIRPGPCVVADTQAARLSCSLRSEADVHARFLANSLDGLLLALEGCQRRFRLVGRFNAYNLLLAYGALTALGHPAERVLEAMGEAVPPPGRFESIRCEDGTHVIVDYAHTPAALRQVLCTILETRPRAADLWCVFGCGGDRDREKRPLMAAEAERLADHLIVTSDNPRSEDPPAHSGGYSWGAGRPGTGAIPSRSR